MLKMLLKAAVLFLIIMSVYLIVNPTACSNMLAGRERSSSQQEQGQRNPMNEQGQDVSNKQNQPDEMFTPTADQAQHQGVIDTNTLQEESKSPVYSQQDIDYAIASRYVELEREYARNHTVGKDTSREISFIVMDDFEMSPAEWESFLSRATASGLFEKVRKELPVIQSTSVK